MPYPTEMIHFVEVYVYKLRAMPLGGAGTNGPVREFEDGRRMEATYMHDVQVNKYRLVAGIRCCVHFDRSSCVEANCEDICKMISRKGLAPKSHPVERVYQ